MAGYGDPPSYNSGECGDENSESIFEDSSFIDEEEKKAYNRDIDRSRSALARDLMPTRRELKPENLRQQLLQKSVTRSENSACGVAGPLLASTPRKDGNSSVSSGEIVLSPIPKLVLPNRHRCSDESEAKAGAFRMSDVFTASDDSIPSGGVNIEAVESESSHSVLIISDSEGDAGEGAFAPTANKASKKTKKLIDFSSESSGESDDDKTNLSKRFMATVSMASDDGGDSDSRSRSSLSFLGGSVPAKDEQKSADMEATLLKEFAGLSKEDMKNRLKALKSLKFSTNLSLLPDKGNKIISQIRVLESLVMAKSEQLKEEAKGGRDENEAAKGEPLSEASKGIAPKKVKAAELDLLLSNKPAHQRLFGGKMTDDRMNVAKAITFEVVGKIHSSVANCPSEEEEMPTPKGLRTELMRHQRQGLKWLLWRERQSPPGGILADDMGLGKTLSMIALIQHQNRNEVSQEYEETKKRAIWNNRLVPSKGTLVVAPASLLYQWEAEFEKHVKPGELRVHVFHGPKQKRESNAKRLARYDVVITTYALVSSELAEKKLIDGDSTDSSLQSSDDGDGPEVAKTRTKRVCSSNSNSVLAQIAWERVVLDEAHQIKNRTSLASKCCCRLAALSRWCLTGTPIHNKLWDLFSLIRFLRVSPFDEEAVWKQWIMSNSQSSADRLNTLVKGLLLRRVKEQIDPITNTPIISLKPKTFENVELEMTGLEKKIYEIMFAASRQQVKELIEQGDEEKYGYRRRRKGHEDAVPIRNPFVGGARIIEPSDNFQTMSCMLTLLLRLRQACVHLALTKKAVDMDAFESIGTDVEEAKVMEDFSNMSIVDEDAIKAELIADGDEGSENVEALFEYYYKSTKLRALLARMDHALTNGDKCVIVSQWTTLLDIVEVHLKKRRIEFTSINGKVLTKDRQPRVDSFNKTDGGARVMLLSLTAGGVGLNLIGGNHLFLLDLHWNPALEQQASDRIYRMGQTKSVFIHKLICKDTIEQRVLALQEKKKTMATSVLEGAASKKLSKLTVADLKYLFELDRPAAPAVAAKVNANAAATGNIAAAALPPAAFITAKNMLTKRF